MYLLFFLMYLSGCQKQIVPDVSGSTQTFDSIPHRFDVRPMIVEASGIADSKKNPGYLWVQEDSGQPNDIHLLSHSGNVLKRIPIKGSFNRDWEDMLLSGGKIYIGEIGDNTQSYPSYAFYIFPEPEKSVDTIHTLEKITFTYNDGSHDAEAFLVDPSTTDIYIITKRDNPSAIYKIAAPYSSSAIQVAKRIGQLNVSGVTGAALSPDAKQILVKTYASLFLFSRNNSEKLETVLQKKPVAAPYLLEPQGEAVCFAIDNTGYFTLSEKSFSSTQYLFFYKKR